MTTQEIAARLVELGRQGAFEKAHQELYAQDAVSIEPHGTPEFDKETKGMTAITEKGQRWNAMVVDTHSLKFSDPVIAANSFACTLEMDLTMKEGGRMQMNELCVYTVKDGKITSEQFFM